ncbi:acid protease [Tothia fuscella]|uniref:Acid protease n=1 Tax=Tothia fuscella TaxID=1048955 RepID=A0A9P4NDT7_9PEZI|nr:acid protease [Tothia fuscella]
MALWKRATTVPAPVVVQPSQSFEGSEGAWSTFNVGVGTPLQYFHVLASTQSSETWVLDPLGCQPSDPTNCPQLRGAQPFNGQQSRGFLFNASNTYKQAGVYSLDLEKNLNYTGNGVYGYDVVALNGGNGSADGASLNGQVVASIASKDYFLGMFGLGIRPTSFSSSAASVPSFIQTIRANNLIPSLSYGFTAGAVYRNKQVFANLVLGGFDQSRFTNPNISFSFGAGDAAPLTIGVQSIVAENTLLGTASFTATTGGHLSVIDSSVPQLWLPKAICDQMEQALGLMYQPDSDLYLINDTMHARLSSLKPSFTFKFGNTQYDTGAANSTNIVVPYSAFDLKVGWPTYSTDQNYFPIRRATQNNQNTIGRALLQEAYIVVDHERRNFTIGQALFPDPLPEQRIVTIHPKGADTDDSKSLSGGAIAGIVVGAIAGILLLAAAIFWWMRRRKSQRTKAAELADTQKRMSEANGMDKNEHEYGDRTQTNSHAGTAELGSGRDHQISELAGGSAYAPDRKDAHGGRHSQLTELPSPVPVFEMMGDTPQRGHAGTYSSTPGSPYSRGPSPYNTESSPGGTR